MYDKSEFELFAKLSIGQYMPTGSVIHRLDPRIKVVLGIVTFPSMVKWTKTAEGQRPTIDDMLDHIDYISNLVGVKHIGFGFDFIHSFFHWENLISAFTIYAEESTSHHANFFPPVFHFTLLHNIIFSL